MNLAEFPIKENTQAVAHPTSELPLRRSFASTIVSIERQGMPIPNPSADTVLYPNDKLLLLGQDSDLRRRLVAQNCILLYHRFTLCVACAKPDRPRNYGRFAE